MLVKFIYAAYLLSRYKKYVGCIDAKEFLELLEKNHNKIITGYYIVKYNNEYKFVIDDMEDPYDFNNKEIIEELYPYEGFLYVHYVILFIVLCELVYKIFYGHMR